MKYKFIGNETTRLTINGEELLVKTNEVIDSKKEITHELFEKIVEKNKSKVKED